MENVIGAWTLGRNQVLPRWCLADWGFGGQSRTRTLECVNNSSELVTNQRGNRVHPGGQSGMRRHQGPKGKVVEGPQSLHGDGRGGHKLGKPQGGNTGNLKLGKLREHCLRDKKISIKGPLFVYDVVGKA